MFYWVFTPVCVYDLRDVKNIDSWETIEDKKLNKKKYSKFLWTLLFK